VSDDAAVPPFFAEGCIGAVLGFVLDLLLDVDGWPFAFLPRRKRRKRGKAGMHVTRMVPKYSTMLKEECE